MKILFIIVPIIVLCVFIFVISMILSPRLRGKWMSRQIKMTKYMIDESKDDLAELGTTMGNIGIKTQKNILDENEDTLKEMSTRKANISKGAIEITSRAIKDGFTKNAIYCKYCGNNIDNDSIYCKNCGKRQ